MRFCTAKIPKESWHLSLDNLLVMKSSHQLLEDNNKTKQRTTLNRTMISPLRCIEHPNQPKKTVKILLKHLKTHYVNANPKELRKSAVLDLNRKTNSLIYIPIKCQLNSDPPQMVSHLRWSHLRKLICSRTTLARIQWVSTAVTTTTTTLATWIQWCCLPQTTARLTSWVWIHSIRGIILSTVCPRIRL